MIRYSADDLEDRIQALSASWLDDAQARTVKLEAAGCYHEEFDDDETKISWSTIKSAYRQIQQQKCAYCERPLAGEEHGAGEHDVEHFRPKRKVDGWGKRKNAPRPQLGFQIKKGRKEGYYWLAFNIWNYCTSCKPCNTSLKGNRFPIMGSSGEEQSTIAELDAVERPLLIYPLGERDEDPSQLITFTGLTARPVSSQGDAWKRAAATIEFFRLNDRVELAKQRAGAIVLIWSAFLREESAPDDDAQAAARQQTEELAAADGLSQANCARAYHALLRQNRDEAERIYDEAFTLYLQYIGERIHG